MAKIMTERTGLDPDMEVTNRITLPIMSVAEKSVIISKRHHQIDDPNNSSTYSELELKSLGLTSSYDIAMYEFDTGKIPYYEVIRVYPNGRYEVWKHNDFKMFPD